ncbi:MAG: S49 family peptidase, partial [Cyclobacteriaceae bacterium]|nr:S49 family peptidase [Cyclobacteriaceae bacterium]
MSFLRNFLAVIAGLVIFSLFSFFVFIGIVASLENDEIPTVKENSVLYLKMSGLLTERTQEDPLQELLPQSGPAFTGLLDLLDAIKAAKSDDNIRGIYMEHQYLAAGFASLQEVRNALLDFKESGKFIYSYGAYVSEGDYFLASVADTIMLHPEGSLEFNGLAVTMTFWKGMFDKLGIEPEIFRVGQYKSYVEPFQQKSMSAENRTQYKELLTSVYTHYLKEVAKSRDTDAQKLRNISDQLLVQLPSDAVSYGLVTRLAYEDEAKALIRTRIGLEADQEISFISHKSYSKTVTNEFSKNKVAVIVASGEIVMGGGENVISGEQFAREIRKARENEQIKAIVLRV